MIPAQRRRHIRDVVLTQGSTTISVLSDRLGVSEMTIRRDLEALEKEGFLQRTHGGAVRTQRANTTEPRYTAKQGIYSAEKSAIARYASENLVHDGDIVILEGGTTVSMMAQYLDRDELTIVTNGLYTMNALQQLLAGATVIGCGGILRDVSLTFVGPVAEHFFLEFHANKAFLSATGFSEKGRFTDPSMLEMQVKKAMCSSAEQIIVLLDSSKFGVRSLSTVLEIEDVDVLVTDEAAPEPVLKELEAAGIDIHVAGVASKAPASKA